MSQKIHLNIYIFKSICTLNNTVLVLTLILIINNYTEKRGNMSKKLIPMIFRIHRQIAAHFDPPFPLPPRRISFSH